jgi:hypothetical protein
MRPIFNPAFRGTFMPGFRPMPMFRFNPVFQGVRPMSTFGFNPAFRPGAFQRRFDRIEDRAERRFDRIEDRAERRFDRIEDRRMR